jgi:glutamate racemase
MIGIFDSGIGGLTVVKAVEQLLPKVPFLYLGDTARLPYGNKSAETVIRYALEDAAFLVKEGATMLVVACNTMSSVAIPALKKAYPTLPIIDVIEPAIQEALKITAGRIGVIGTRATVASGVYQARLKERHAKATIFAQACPLLVPLVEENWLDRPVTKMVVRGYLSGLKHKSIDSLILGCTHYPLLRSLIKAKAGKRVRLVDPAEETARAIQEALTAHPELASANASSRFFLTDLTPQAEQLAARWLGHEVKFEKASLE